MRKSACASAYGRTMSPARSDRPPLRGGVTVLLLALLAVGATVGSAGVAMAQQANEAPTAAFDHSPAEPAPGEAIVLNASASSDPDGDVATYQWDLNDDGQVDAEGGPNQRVAFPRAGAYTVRLTVVDDDGATDTTSRTIQVVGTEPPVAELSVSAETVRTGETVTLDPSGSSDPDGPLASWAYDTDGDGSFEETFESPTTLRTSYGEPGTYEITLRVTDTDGMTATATATVVVEAPATPTDGGPTPDGTTGGASPTTAGPAAGDGDGGDDGLLPGGGLAIALGLLVLVLVGGGVVLYARSGTAGPQADGHSPWPDSGGASSGVGAGPVASVVLALVLVLVVVGGPVYLVNRRFASVAGGATELTIAMLQFGALALVALAVVVHLLLRFVEGVEGGRAGGTVGALSADGLRQLTLALGFVASVLVTVGVATLLLAGSLPTHLTVAAGLLVAGLSAVPLLLAVVLLSRSLG